MALLEMVHTRILQSVIMEKRIYSLNIEWLIFRTLQYIKTYLELCGSVELCLQGL